MTRRRSIFYYKVRGVFEGIGCDGGVLSDESDRSVRDEGLVKLD